MLFSKREILEVRGMSCAHCEKTVERGLQEVPGVRRAKADHTQDRVKVFFKGEAPDMQAVREKIVDLGYEVAPS